MTTTSTSSPGPSVTSRSRGAAAVAHAHARAAVFDAHGVAPNDQRVAHAVELDVDRSGQIRQQPVARAVDGDDGAERAHAGGEGAGQRDRRDLRDAARQREVGVGVEPHGDPLPGPEVLHVGLVHARAHLHRGLVHHLEHGRPRPELIAFLDVGRAGALPHRAGDDEAVDRRADGERRRVGGGVLHGRVRAIALDLEHAQLGARGLALQIEAGAQRGETLPRLVEILVVLLGLDGGEHLVLQHLELEVRHLVGGLLTLALVLDAGRLVLGALLRDLLHEIAVFRGLLEGSLSWFWPIELHEHVAARDVAARRGEAGDDQRFARARRRPRRRRSGAAR